MKENWWKITPICAVLFAAMGASHAADDADRSRGEKPRAAAEQERARPSAPDLGRWDQAELRGGYSVNRLIDLRVRDRNGETVGKIGDLLLNQRGRITAVEIKSGGVIGIGEKRFRAPWNDVQITGGVDHAIVSADPRRQTNQRSSEERLKREREYRITALLDDTVEFGDGTRFARLDDLIIRRNGEIKGLVADTGGFGPLGRYAFPYRRDAHEFERDAYKTPYDRNQVANARPFDYTALNIAAPATRGTGATTSPARDKQERYDSKSGTR